MSECVRRLPVYLLLDCSESMAGEAIEDVGRGVDTMVATLRSDPVALESTWLSLITFSRDAEQVVPLTEVLHFQRPKLRVRPGTAMGAALRLALRCIDHEVTKTSPTSKGDYKPLVFLVTDGQPTDEWESAAASVQSPRNAWRSNLLAVACGPDADTDILRRIAPNVLLMKDMAPKAWRDTFQWVTQSVQTTSQSVGRAREGEGVSLPAPPADALEVAPADAGVRDPRPRQVFLHAWCSQDGKPYLMRFIRSPQGEKYRAVRSHPLDAVEEDQGDGLPPIHSSLLEGCPPCPYCDNPAAGLCACGALLCAPGSAEVVTVTCPRCRQTLSFRPDGGGGQGGEQQDFQVPRSLD